MEAISVFTVSHEASPEELDRVLECVAKKAKIHKPDAAGGEVHVASDRYDTVRQALVTCDPTGLLVPSEQG
jgi:hypothetical protein